MSRLSRKTAALRPRGRPRKNALPVARFAPIRLTDALGARQEPPLVCVFELLFADGLVLRVARDADPATLERLVARLRRHGN